MTLFRETIDFILWLFRVLLAFIRVRPLTTVAVIAMSASSRALQVLAFLMPLKVLMLAASPGVPSKLWFISPEQKMLWIYILTGASIMSYFLMLFFDTITDKMSLSGSRDLLNEAGAIPLFENQQALAQSYYSGFSELCADGIFVGLAFLAGFFIYFDFFVFLAVTIIIFFLLSCILVRPLEKSLPGTFSHYLRENYKSYTKVLSSFFFLGAFLYLLISLTLYSSTDLIIAIVAFIILRRTLSAVRSVVTNAISLTTKKHRINALVFPEVQLEEKQKPEDIAFKEFFNKQARQNHVQEALEQAVSLEEKMDVLWEDSTIPGVVSFAIVAPNDAQGDFPCFRQHVYPLKQTRKLENEDFLFTSIPRHHLKAPEVITLYYLAQFQCQILEYGTVQKPDNKQWPCVQDNLLSDLWSYTPPQDLVRTCCASAPRLHERLNNNLLSWSELAVDKKKEADILQNFISALPLIRDRLKTLPLHVYNPDLNQNNVIMTKDGDFLVMTWGRWSLEPVGVGLPPRLRKNGLSEIVEDIREKRKDVPENYSEADIFLADDCFKLEDLVKKGKYKNALQTMQRILETIPKALDNTVKENESEDT